MQTGGQDIDQDFTFGRNRICEGGKPGRLIEGVYDGCIHECSPLGGSLVRLDISKSNLDSSWDSQLYSVTGESEYELLRFITL
jgi:hypothetical protein